VPTLQFNLQEVVNALNAKVAQLEQDKQAVEAAIKGGNNTQENQQCLQRMNDSLESSQEALNALSDACCGTQTCFYDYDAAAQSS
jgi:lipid II:glycine glycyltransferase (peptidoglycan interpeptide bridge formation enzyme)